MGRAALVQPALPDRPHPALRGVWFWRGLGLGALLAPFVSWPLLFPLASFLRLAGTSIAPSYAIAASLLAGLYVVGLWTWTRLAFSRLRFEIGADEIRIHKGVWSTSVTRIPLARVRRVTVRRGPLLRRRGLATVRIEVFGVFDASPRAPDGQLPGLRNAEAVAAWIVERLPRAPQPEATGALSVPRRTRSSG